MFSTKAAHATFKLGNFEAGKSQEYEFSFFVSGPEAEDVCNKARTQSHPDEDEACFQVVNQLGLIPAQLPPAKVGVSYNEVITITGGLQPYQADVNGLPAGGLDYEFDGVSNVIRIYGCPKADPESTLPLSVDVAYSVDGYNQACESLEQDYNVVPAC